MICVASQNPVKINAALSGFQRMFPDRLWEAKGISVPSGVSDQPMSCEETYQGALNRLNAITELCAEADYHVGIEGGLEELHGELAAFAWILVRGEGRLAKGRTASFFLAPRVTELVRGGMEMGFADDEVFGHTDSKRNQGATGILTGGVIDRAEFYAHAVIMALIPFKNKAHYPKDFHQ